MFTGLITDIGTVQSIDGGRFMIACNYLAETIAIGASIACDGCCLTAITVENTSDTTCLFAVDVSNETLSCTTLQNWKTGQKINLERSLRVGDELGGHIVSGHVDGVAQILRLEKDGNSVRFRFRAPDPLACFIAAKGSVALDGTSLTVNSVDGSDFEVNVIPHTLHVTTWGTKSAGDQVNLEVDLLARYVARQNTSLSIRD